MAIHSRRCSATCKDGSRCRQWAVRGTDPPLCPSHGGCEAKIGAPAGNANALKHGAYAQMETVRRLVATAEDLLDGEVEEARAPSGRDGWSIETIIVDLSIKQSLLSRYIQAHLEELRVEQLGGLLRIHGQNASRLGRLLSIQQALTGDGDSAIEEAMNRALDEVGEELGIEL